MEITLGTRTADTVRIYFEKANRPEIRQVLPQKATSVEEALADYEKTLLPDATSFGRTVHADGRYIGDVWCYCINMDDDPNCMVSFCIFEKTLLTLIQTNDSFQKTQKDAFLRLRSYNLHCEKTKNPAAA